MLLTESKLRQIIKEEYEEIMSESKRARQMKSQMNFDKAARKERERNEPGENFRSLSGNQGIKTNKKSRYSDDDGNTVGSFEDDEMSEVVMKEVDSYGRETRREREEASEKASRNKKRPSRKKLPHGSATEDGQETPEEIARWRKEHEND